MESTGGTGEAPIKEESKTFKTVREYYEDSYRCLSSSKVQDISPTDKPNEFQIILESTIFHPQGGGQPSDEGFITDGVIKFIVKGLKSQNEAILHIGHFEQEEKKFDQGQEVQLHVNEDFRRQVARFHSAGHLLDMSMKRLGQFQLRPGKGYHFTKGAYVEYFGLIDMTKKEQLLKDLNAVSNQIIAEQSQEEGVWSKVVPYDEAAKILEGGVPDYMPKGSEMRVVKLSKEDPGCPCGGTHVKHLNDIQGIEVTKIVKKGQNTRVSYTVINK